MQDLIQGFMSSRAHLRNVYTYISPGYFLEIKYSCFKRKLAKMAVHYMQRWTNISKNTNRMSYEAAKVKLMEEHDDTT